LERAVIWSAKVRCSSKMKPRFRAEWEVSSEELCILASWFLSLMSKNSVLVRRLAVIQEEMCVVLYCRPIVVLCCMVLSKRSRSE